MPYDPPLVVTAGGGTKVRTVYMYDPPPDFGRKKMWGGGGVEEEGKGGGVEGHLLPPPTTYIFATCLHLPNCLSLKSLLERIYSTMFSLMMVSSTLHITLAKLTGRYAHFHSCGSFPKSFDFLYINDNVYDSTSLIPLTILGVTSLGLFSKDMLNIFKTFDLILIC